MCKLCNLFSPNQAELLSHVSEKHTEEGTSVDDIIIPLQPLTVPANTNRDGEGTVMNWGVSDAEAMGFLIKAVAWRFCVVRRTI